MHIPTDISQLADIIFGVFAYTEMHYRFKLTGSRYFKKEPEILADIPHRINQEMSIPVLFLVKDADKFPIDLLSVQIMINQNQTEIFSKTIIVGQKITEPLWFITIDIPQPEITGSVEIDVKFEYKVGDKILSCINHNLKLLKRKPIQVFLAKESLPGDSEVIWGDLHYHSFLTEDMVEFGAPLSATMHACQAIGLDFFCPADHSYDLDDKSGSWIETDPQLQKWHDSRMQIQELNKQFDFEPFILPAEELTLHNNKGRNVHALILNNPEFLSGQGDGAERWFDFSSEYSTSSVISKLDANALYIAAHPKTPVPITEWLLIKRGQWEDTDMTHPVLSGLQILNGAVDKGFWRGLKKWVTLLLEGHKKFIYAGTDAHGNFNIFRQINIPMLTLHEKDEQIFGECRTGVFPKQKRNIGAVIEALKMGNCIISNGPFIKIFGHCENFKIEMGSTFQIEKGKNIQLNISVKSNSEFGALKYLKIKVGIIGTRFEQIIFDQNFSENKYEFNHTLQQTIKRNCYFRAEIETNNYRGKRLALTNPIWFQQI